MTSLTAVGVQSASLGPAVMRTGRPLSLGEAETARRVRQRITSVLDFSHGQAWRATETPRNAVNTLKKRIKQPRRSGGFSG